MKRLYSHFHQTWSFKLICHKCYFAILLCREIKRDCFDTQQPDSYTCWELLIHRISCVKWSRKRNSNFLFLPHCEFPCTYTCVYTRKDAGEDEGERITQHITNNLPASRCLFPFFPLSLFFPSRFTLPVVWVHPQWLLSSESPPLSPVSPPRSATIFLFSCSFLSSASLPGPLLSPPPAIRRGGWARERWDEKVVSMETNHPVSASRIRPSVVVRGSTQDTVPIVRTFPRFSFFYLAALKVSLSVELWVRRSTTSWLSTPFTSKLNALFIRSVIVAEAYKKFWKIMKNRVYDFFVDYYSSGTVTGDYWITLITDRSVLNAIIFT